MKTLYFIFLLIGLLVFGLWSYMKFKKGNVVDSKNLESILDKQCNKFVAEGNAYGLVIGVIKNNKSYLKGYGTVKKGENILPDSSTIFELASTSKLFTTAALQILADDGKLKIEDKIHEILADKVKLPDIAKNTSLQHLATHLSGFPSLPESFLSKMKDDKNPYKNLVEQDIYDYLQTCQGKKEDGVFEYSNFGMGLLGHLLEIKTGLKYEQLVKETLLNKLEMNQTFIALDDAKKSKIAQGYDKNGNESPIWIDNVLTGAGSFLSNGNDMLKFIKANLNENQTQISKSLIATHMQQLNGETGLGWILPSATDNFLGNKNIVWHNGMAGGYASFIVIDKVNNYGFFILSNKAIDVTKFGMKLTISVRTQSLKMPK